MWYKDALKQQWEKDIFSRKELFVMLQKYNPSLNYNSFKWIISELISEQLIYKISHDTYSKSEEGKNAIYTPLYSEKAQKLKDMIQGEYPLAEFCVVESFLLNEFLNHQIVQNTFIVQIEKELGTFVFDFLEEKYGGRILYKPNQKTYQRYWCADCIVVVDKTSEAPYDKQNPHTIVLEKLLVDLFAESVIRDLFSPSEYPLIMETARERYFLDEKKMMRYARRRNVAEKIKNIWSRGE